MNIERGKEKNYKKRVIGSLFFMDTPNDSSSLCRGRYLDCDLTGKKEL
jgi:hypothetical protein